MILRLATGFICFFKWTCIPVLIIGGYAIYTHNVVLTCLYIAYGLALMFGFLTLNILLGMTK